jgi:murein DD-endopeptidase MepM/ murein hydrolase activator NlpD
MDPKNRYPENSLFKRSSDNELVSEFLGEVLTEASLPELANLQTPSEMFLQESPFLNVFGNVELGLDAASTQDNEDFSDDVDEEGCADTPDEEATDFFKYDEFDFEDFLEDEDTEEGLTEDEVIFDESDSEYLLEDDEPLDNEAWPFEGEEALDDNEFFESYGHETVQNNDEFNEELEGEGEGNIDDLEEGFYPERETVWGGESAELDRYNLETKSPVEFEETDNKAPLPIPINKPVPFAPHPPMGSYWPLISTHKKGKDVAYQYQTQPSKYIGNKTRCFLASRSNGARYHVGIDLYANYKDKIVACEAGVIINFYHFYRSTYALIVEHENVVINYGEVHKDSLKANELKRGDSVSAGQVIGFAGRMYASSMLHFEVYRKGTHSNLRWLKGNNVPDTLLNPTKYLLFLQEYGKISNNSTSNVKNTTSSVFQKLKLLSIVFGLISKGERDENRITNVLFYSKYPHKNGLKLKRNDPLVKDWLNIRKNIVRPLLGKLIDSQDSKVNVPLNDHTVPEGKLGYVKYSNGDLKRITPPAVLWLAKMIDAETWGRPTEDDAKSMLWALVQRTAIWKFRKWNWVRMIQAYSQPINPRWTRSGDKCSQYYKVSFGGTIPDRCSVRRVNARTENIQKKWKDVHPIARRVVLEFIAGKIPNHIPGAVGWFAPGTWRSREKNGANKKSNMVYHSTIDGNVYFAMNKRPDTSRWTTHEVMIKNA